MKTKLLNENPNHKCGQTNDHFCIGRKQSVTTSKSFNYCSAAIPALRSCLSMDARGLFLDNVLK